MIKKGFNEYLEVCLVVSADTHESALGALLTGLRNMVQWQSPKGFDKIGISRKKAAQLISERYGINYSVDDLRGAEGGSSISNQERSMLLDFYGEMIASVRLVSENGRKVSTDLVVRSEGKE